MTEATKSEQASKPAQAEKALEFRTSRTFNAPRRLVFDAWSTAEHVSKWFTPKPLTTSACVVDFRPGGAFRVTMRMPDGLEHPMDAKFGEIVPLERITFFGKIPEGNEVHTTVTFTEVNGKTVLDVHQTFSFESDATRGAPTGWAATLDQLGQHVAQS
jgi:uncharacterized protein YndB with AHSA1/START domain